MSWLDIFVSDPNRLKANNLTQEQKALLGVVGAATAVGIAPHLILPMLAVGGAAVGGASVGALSEKIARSSNASEMREHPVTVVFEDDISQQIQSMSESAEISEGEVLKRALALMQVVIQAARDGKKLALLDENDSIVAKITGLVEDNS